MRKSAAVQAAFKKAVLSLVSAIEEMGNPFQEDSTDLLVLDSKEIMDETVVKDQSRSVQSLCQRKIPGKNKANKRSNKEEQVTPVQSTTTEKPDEG